MVDFNQALCKRLHQDNDKEHDEMWKRHEKSDERHDKTNTRIDKIQLLLITNLIGIASTLLIVVVTNFFSQGAP